MNPDLFTIGDITYPPYRVAIIAALAIGIFLSVLAGRKEGLKPYLVLEGCIIIGFAGLVGARLLFVILNWHNYMANPQLIFMFRLAGLSFYGSIIGGVLANYFWTRLRRINHLQMADLLAPYFALGYAITRAFGCFMAGCCYGKVADVPWAVVMVRLEDGLPRHPVQLYAALGAVLIFIILRLLHRRRPAYGFTITAFVFFYGLLRFTTEFFREGEILWAGLTNAQLGSIAAVSGAAVIAFIMLKKQAEYREKAKRGFMG